MGRGGEAWLRQLRRHEVERVIALLRQQGVAENARLLEIGASCGYQAQLLAQAGFVVTAVDLAGACRGGVYDHPVIPYDGFRLPFANACFDAVFSSNVLEHIPHVEAFLRLEVQRVLKPGGVAVHILPSATWRLWSFLTHYLEIPWYLSRLHRRDTPLMPRSVARSQPRSLLSTLMRMAVLVLVSPRHGEHGSRLTEPWLFSRFRFDKLFRATGWEQVQRWPGGLWYTGYTIMGDWLPLATRERLSRRLGSSTHIYLTRKPL